MMDPLPFEIIRGGLDSLADQAAITLMRTAYSPLVRDSLDYSTALFDADGRMLAQGLTTPLHIGSFPDAIDAVMAESGDDMQPGDVFTLNDPYGSGGMHLPDIYVIKPVFRGASVVAYVTTLTHHADVGGLTPGSNSVHSTEIFQEGLRIPILKLFDGGTPNRTLFKMIERNSRLPRFVLGDIRAQVAGCRAAENGLLEMFDEFGADMMRMAFDGLVDLSENVMRLEISEIPNGVYRFSDFIDGLGDNPDRLEFHVAVVVRDTTMTIDWTGTCPQVEAEINSPLPFTKAATYLAARLICRRDMPNSSGYMHCLDTIAPPGTIVNPTEPAACATRGIVGMRAVDAILGALAKAVPDRVPAAGEGGVSWPTLGGFVEGERFVYAESIMGTQGGRPSADGATGMPHPGANQPNQPVEVIETRYPLRVLEYRLVPDSGGPGKHRGGLALERRYEVLVDGVTLTLRTDRRYHRPYGLWGGKPGTSSLTFLERNGGRETLPPLPMRAIRLDRGDMFVHRIAGGGGWGDPLERDPVLVERDVREGRLTPEHARSEYGVIIDMESKKVDIGATESERTRA
jgi:N-methylhydantoinase B